MVKAVEPSLMAQNQTRFFHSGLKLSLCKGQKKEIKLYLFIKGDFLVSLKESGGRKRDLSNCPGCL